MSVIKQLTKKTSSGTETHDIGAEASKVTMSNGTTVENAIMEKALYGAYMQNNILHITQFDGRDIQVKLPISKSADIVIAAYDAPDNWKAAADYVCDGKADDVEINAAINALGVNGGKILLSTGTFYITNPIDVSTKYFVLQGMGASTRICTAQYITNSYSSMLCVGIGAPHVVCAVKDVCLCNNASLARTFINGYYKSLDVQNVVFTSAYSVPTTLGYTAKNFTYGDNPGALWSDSFGSTLNSDEQGLRIKNCRVASDYKDTPYYVTGDMKLDELYLPDGSVVQVTHSDNIVNVMPAEGSASITVTVLAESTYGVLSSNNRIIKNPGITINDSGINTIIA